MTYQVMTESEGPGIVLLKIVLLHFVFPAIISIAASSPLFAA